MSRIRSALGDLARVGHCVGQTWPTLWRLRPTVVGCGSTLAHDRPHVGDECRYWPHVGRLWHRSDNTRATVKEVGPHWAEFRGGRHVESRNLNCSQRPRMSAQPRSCRVPLGPCSSADLAGSSGSRNLSPRPLLLCRSCVAHAPCGRRWSAAPPQAGRAPRRHWGALRGRRRARSRPVWRRLRPPSGTTTGPRRPRSRARARACAPTRAPVSAQTEFAGGQAAAHFAMFWIRRSLGRGATSRVQTVDPES